MRKFLNLLSIALVVMIGILGTACEVDPCKDVVCNNTDANAFCLEGSCVCSPGYEGTDCSTLSATRFEGSYDAVETCDVAGSYTYVDPVVVSASAVDPSKIFLNNLTDFDCNGSSVNASANIVLNEFTLDSTEVHCDLPGLVGFTIGGTGTYFEATSTITLNYRIYFLDNTSDNCTITLTKK